MAGSERPRLRGMTLTVTERCNLRCGYCYVPVERGRAMTAETVDAAVDLFARHTADVPRVALSFFGGEPFLAPALVRRAIVRARERMPRGREVRVATPTNGTLVAGENLALCRDERIELAVSVDGEGDAGNRPFAGGTSSEDRLRDLLPDILTLDPVARVTARMTVTPANVDRLCENVRAVARLGFRRIIFLPAFEMEWNDAAVDAWAREHRRIGTWLVGMHGTGRKPPDLPGWRAIESRLTLGKPRKACGAGARLAAVSADGALFPCYRFVFAEDPGDGRLGDVGTGFTNRDALAFFAALGPSMARPEDGDCASCPSGDGCTFFCPALGQWMLRDPLAIPAAACRLLRAQVEAIRPYAAAQPRATSRRSRPRWAAAAAVAAAVTGASAAASCYTSEPGACPPVPEDGDVADEATGDAATDDGIGPGLCPVAADADADVEDVPVGGVCPVGPDADADADVEDVIGPGLCPDASDADADVDVEDVPVGGICPVGPDGDADDAEDGPIGGIC